MIYRSEIANRRSQSENPGVGSSSAGRKRETRIARAVIQMGGSNHGRLVARSRDEIPVWPQSYHRFRACDRRRQRRFRLSLRPHLRSFSRIAKNFARADGAQHSDQRIDRNDPSSRLRFCLLVQSEHTQLRSAPAAYRASESLPQKRLDFRRHDSRFGFHNCVRRTPCHLSPSPVNRESSRSELANCVRDVPVVERVDSLSGIDILSAEAIEVLMAKTNGKLSLFVRIAWKR